MGKVKRQQREREREAALGNAVDCRNKTLRHCQDISFAETQHYA